MSVSVEVSNLGPLRSAEVDFADLTLFIGENNTGKTFFATVLHRILQVPHASQRFVGAKTPDEVLQWFERRLTPPGSGTLLPGDACVPPTKAVLDWATRTTVGALEDFGADVRRAIEYAFGVNASELRRRTPSRHSSDCHLRIRSTEPAWCVEVRFDADDILVEPPDPAVWLQRMIDEESGAGPRRRRPVREPSLMRRLAAGYGGYRPRPDELFPGWPRVPVHLPANRTGIMQSYQLLAAAVVRRSAGAGIRPIEVGTLPGVSADFLSLLLSDEEHLRWTRHEDVRISALIEDFEKDLRAEIALEQRANSVPAVTAVTPEGTFPLSRASSMLSELAPILLVLKGAFGGADHLTIDEPEAHLHPAMQRKVASFLVDVVNAGKGVTLTTHSDFFLGEINNLIRAGKLADPQEPLLPDQTTGSEQSRVRALQFSREDRWCVGRRLPLDQVDGIDESTFTNVMESLYDDSVRLIDELI